MLPSTLQEAQAVMRALREQMAQLERMLALWEAIEQAIKKEMEPTHAP